MTCRGKWKYEFYRKNNKFQVMRAAALYGGMQIKKYYSKAENADKVSEKLLMKLLKKSRDTEFGKKYNFADITGAVKSFEERTGITVNDYCIYPDTDNIPWKIVMFIETQSDISTETVEQLGNIFDEELSKTNREHERMLKIGETSPSVVYPVQKGTFGKYREYKVSKGTSQNQVKSIRVITTRNS